MPMRPADVIAKANALIKADQTQAAVDLLIDAAKRGDGDALHELALWHVYGSPVPRSFAAARALFEKAGVAGHRGGALTHAVFVALGAGGPADWRTALALLDKAAELDPVALRQRDLIAAMRWRARCSRPTNARMSWRYRHRNWSLRSSSIPRRDAKSRTPSAPLKAQSLARSSRIWSSTRLTGGLRW